MLRGSIYNKEVCFHGQTQLASKPICWAATELNVSLLSTAVDCGTLTTPANGQVSYSGRTTFGHTATYSCHTGYNLRGESTRTCQTTKLWSRSEPTCSRMSLLYDFQLMVHVHGASPSFNSCGLRYSDQPSQWPS